MINIENIMQNFVEVEVKKEDFLRVVETLTRIGVLSSDTSKLFQSCHLLHKRGKYYLVSFKEMFLLDGKESNFTQEDKFRRNKIVGMLQEWGLLTIINTDAAKNDEFFPAKISVIPYKEKSKYTLISKYTIGKPKRN